MRRIIYVPCVGYYVAAVAHYKFKYDIIKELGYQGGVNWAAYQIASHFLLILLITYLTISPE